MRLIILNMMIWGMATNLIGDNVFAKDFVKTSNISQENFAYEKSQNNIRKNLKNKKEALNSKKFRKQIEKQTDISNFSGAKIPPAPPRPSVSDSDIDSGKVPPAPPRPPVADSDIDSGKVPPAPPRPSVSDTDSGKVPPPPPLPPFATIDDIPSPLPSSVGMSLTAKEVNIEIIMKDLRRELNEFLDDNGIKIMANIVNLYLEGNKEKISEGISTAEAAMIRLNNRLNNDLEEMRKTVDAKPSNGDSKDREKAAAANSVIKEYIAIFESLPIYLKKLTAKGYRSEDTDKRKTFREISKEINKIAHEYFQKVITSGENLKKVSNLTALKDAEIVLERAVVLSDSFSNLVNLSMGSRNEAFSERSTRDAIEIINLKRLIFNKLQEINSAAQSAAQQDPTEVNFSEEGYSNEEYLKNVLQNIDKIFAGNSQLKNLKEFISDKLKEIDPATLKKLVKLSAGNRTFENKQSVSSENFVKLPTGDKISEKEYLERALRYIDETCKGNDQLQKLLDMRDVLNNKYTTIVSNDQTGNKKNPLIIIRNLDNRIAKIGSLLEQAGKKSQYNKYNQFGRMFTEGDTVYGGALIASVNQWINSEDFAEFSTDKIRKSFQGKNLSGDIVAEYIKLLTSDMNLCKSFAKSVISTMSRRKNFKASSFVSTHKQTETKKENRETLLKIKNGKIDLGTKSDPQRDKNLIPFSMLKKNCEEYAKEIYTAVKEIKEIPEIMKKIKKGFSKEVGQDQLSTYIEGIVNSYFIFKNFESKDNQISFSVVNTEKGLLSTEDVPNVVFALAQNCDLAVKQPASPLFPTSKDTDNEWVLEMALDVQNAISEIINAISDANAEISAETNRNSKTKVGEIIKKLQKTENLIGEAVSRSSQAIPTAISNTPKEIWAKKERINKAKFRKTAIPRRAERFESERFESER